MELLSKINKVIKVPPSMMMGSWMGSDFTNDDLVKETQLIDAYSLDLSEQTTSTRSRLPPKTNRNSVGQDQAPSLKIPLLPLCKHSSMKTGKNPAN
ncbi:MAG: outer membrane lipoprotein-sorting protein [Candidatus Azotimanducaceae bacterium WSBS_2022_MAG_OTU7]